MHHFNFHYLLPSIKLVALVTAWPGIFIAWALNIKRVVAIGLQSNRAQIDVIQMRCDSGISRFAGTNYPFGRLLKKHTCLWIGQVNGICKAFIKSDIAKTEVAIMNHDIKAFCKRLCFHYLFGGRINDGNTNLVEGDIVFG